MCQLIIWNPLIIYQRFSSAITFDKEPGAIIDIRYNVNGVLVQGWRGWLVDVLGTLQPQRHAIRADHRTRGLGQVDAINNDIFTQIGDNAKTGGVVRNVLAAGDWRFPTVIDPGRTVLDNFAGRVNRTQGLLQSGSRSAVSALQAIEVACQAEVGRCYDDRLGQIRFEDRTRRSLASQRTPIDLLEGSRHPVQPRELHRRRTERGIGGRGEARDHRQAGTGRQRLRRRRLPLPHTLTIPAADSSAAGRIESACSSITPTLCASQT